MSNENGEKSESLQEFLQQLGLPQLAENIDGSGYTPETLSQLSVTELQESFMLSKEIAKKVYSKLDRFRKPETAKQQIKGLTTMISKLFASTSSSSKNNTINFTSAFDHVTGVDDFKALDEYSMDPCCIAYSATYHFFQEDFDRNSEQYQNFSNENEWTPLMYACAIRQEKIVEKLLTQNPDICIQNNEKQTALMLAACFGHVSILEKLIQYSKERSKILRKYYVEIAGLHLADNVGFTALHYAVFYAQEDAVKFLLTIGANPNLPDKDNMTPTLIACSEKARKSCLTELLKANGNLNLRNKNGKSGYDLQKAFLPKKSAAQKTFKSQVYGRF